MLHLDGIIGHMYSQESAKMSAARDNLDETRFWLLRLGSSGAMDITSKVNVDSISIHDFPESALICVVNELS